MNVRGTMIAQASSSNSSTADLVASSSVTKSTRPTTSFPQDAFTVRQNLEKHGIVSNDLAAYDNQNNFAQHIQSIIWKGEFISPNADFVKRFQRKQQMYANTNEATWLRYLLPLIVQDGPKGPSDVLNRVYTMEDWEERGISVSKDAEFLPSALPNRYFDEGFEPAVVEQLTKDEMTNPRPDECYGLQMKVLSEYDDILTDEPNALLSLAPYMRHAFFFIEGKGGRDINAEAEIQAQRGGACLVNAKRMLLEYMGEPDVTGADRRSFVFSATIGSDVIKLWVHWAEVTPISTVFHMNNLLSKLISDSDSLAVYRQAFHNIVQWGVVDRLDELRALHERLRVFERKKIEQMNEAIQKNKRQKKD